MRALSVIGMILSILIIVGSFLAMGAAYASHQNQMSDDFGQFGGYIRRFDYTPYIVGAVIGFVLLILSIIGMSVSKKKPQPIVNVYNQQPFHQQAPSQVSTNNQSYNQTQQHQSTEIDFLINQAIQSYNARDYNNAIGILNRAATIAPMHSTVHYNLACLYSLTNQKDEAFNSLGKAVETGYTNFEKIRTIPDLNWLRSQPEYFSFIQNGYKNSPVSQAVGASQPTVNNYSAPSLNDDVIAKLERLAKLKDQGILTEDELNEQKKKLLS